jgi:hypothetical protein
MKNTEGPDRLRDLLLFKRELVVKQRKVLWKRKKDLLQNNLKLKQLLKKKRIESMPKKKPSKIRNQRNMMKKK